MKDMVTNDVPPGAVQHIQSEFYAMVLHVPLELWDKDGVLYRRRHMMLELQPYGRALSAWGDGGQAGLGSQSRESR